MAWSDLSMVFVFDDKRAVPQMFKPTLDLLVGGRWTRPCGGYVIEVFGGAIWCDRGAGACSG